MIIPVRHEPVFAVCVKILLLTMAFEISDVRSAATGIEARAELNRFLQSLRATTPATLIENDPLFARLVAQLWSVHMSNMEDNSTL